MGTLRLAGIDPRLDKDQFSRRAGVLFAQDSLYKRQSSRAGEALAQVGLADHASAKVDKLPPGLVRRLAFGCTILHRPDVLLLVEPFARCDGPTISLWSRLIRQQTVSAPTGLPGELATRQGDHLLHTQQL